MLGSRSRPAATPRRRPPAQRPLQLAARPAPAAINPGRRPFLMLVLFMILAAALISRLVFWQVLQHQRLALDAQEQHDALLVQPALRGQILDAEGTPLATDVTHHLLYAVPRDIKHPVRVAAALSPIIGMPEQELENILSDGTTYAQLAPSVSNAQMNKINQLGFSGIVLSPVIARDYPEGETAAQILGYYGANGQGNYGLEQYYNSLLSGQAGLRSVLQDSAGHLIRISDGPATAPQNGANLKLSLDSFVQNAVETELKKSVAMHHADSGTIIVMDPKTGYILGMASTPTYDPNHYVRWAGDESRFLNPAISWTYEPGSTFKIVTMAAGLDTHVITPQTAFEDTGVWMVDGIALHNWNDQGNGWENMTQVLQHSANVGASFVANRLGTQRFYQYVQRFGIGQDSGIDLAGEEPGILPLPSQKTWTLVSLYTNSFGQGLATTPLQLIRAVATVANGGVMMKPQIVTQIDYGNRIIERPPVKVRRVISKQTAHTLTDMLVHSAVAGEAEEALIKGYNIAAKTGTANIAGDGGYISGATIASTVAYAPAYHPRFVALVILDHPRDQPWGSMTAAPTIHNLFQDLLMHYHIPPSPNAIYR